MRPVRPSIWYWRSRSRERAMRSSLSAMPCSIWICAGLVREQRVLGADAGLDLLHRLLVGGGVDLVHQRLDLRQPVGGGTHRVLQQALVLVGLGQRRLAVGARGAGKVHAVVDHAGVAQRLGGARRGRRSRRCAPR